MTEHKRDEIRLHDVIEWLLGDDTGISSEAIVAHMLGVERPGWRGSFAPSDKADRGRCVRLLRRFPEWEPRLEELVARNGEWADQIPLIRSELLFKGESQ